MILVSKVGILRDAQTGELEGVLILRFANGAEFPCATAVEDAEALLAMDYPELENVEGAEGQVSAAPEVSQGPEGPESLGPINPEDRRAHAVPAPGGAGVSTGTKVKVP